MEQKQKLKKQLTPQFCLSDEIILKLLKAESADDLKLGLNYLGAGEFQHVEDFIHRYGLLTSSKSHPCKFIVKAKGFLIICGWYYMEVYGGKEVCLFNLGHEIIEI